MAKLADVKAAKERKQKKIAAVGGVLLVIVLFVQVPRTLKMMGGGEEAATAATPSAPAAAGTTAPTGSTPAPTPAAQTVATASLVSFSRFASKDPFVPQVEDDSGGSASPDADAGGETGTLADASEESGDGEQAPVPGAASGSAEIEVNGTLETVTAGTPFPAATPMFLLVSVSAKSVAIKVADGGTFATGAPKLQLTLGKPVTLVNTADGTRFVLLLKGVK